MTNSLTQEERDRVSRYITQAHNQVLQVVTDLSDDQLYFKPRPDQWSIGEIVEHLTIIDNLVQNQIENVVVSAVPTPESAWKGRDEDLLELVRSRTTPLKVPEIGQPRNHMRRDELLQRFEAIRDRMREVAPMSGAPLRGLCFPHPVYGQKDCYQWLLTTAAHCERHSDQMREVMSATDFPQRPTSSW